MALRRQGLSQRRRAVGLTQEALAERLGVERSTVVRWEAGDTEPLPSIRPHMAYALEVSIDQLAELLKESQNAGTTRALSADTKVTIPALLPEVQSEALPGRAEFEDLIRPQVAETVEALRRALQSAGVSPEDLDAMLLVGRPSRVPLASAELSRPVDVDPEATIALDAALPGPPADIDHPADIDTTSAEVGPDTPVPTTVGATGFAGSDVPEPAQTEVPHRASLTDPLDVEFADVWRRRARSRRFKRFAAAGVLALVLVGGSVPFINSHSGPIPPAAAGTSASATPVATLPTPDPSSGNSTDSTEAVDTAPAAEPNKPVGDPATPGTTVVPAPRTTRVTTISRTATSRSKPPAAVTPPPRPRSPAVPAEADARARKAVAYARSRKAALSPRDQHRTHLHPESPPRP